MKTINVNIRGKVQGVYFRQSTKEKAKELGITGNVKNLDDGTVNIEATGSDEQLNRLVHWLHIGPSGARVENVQVEEFPSVQHFTDFRIVRS